MYPRNPQTGLNQQILDEAAEWFVEMEGDEADFACRQKFDDWLRRSPEHVRAFLELLPVWESAGAHQPSSDADPQHLINRFLSAKAEVVPLARLRAAVSTSANRRNLLLGKPRRVAALAASFILVGGSLCLWLDAQRGSFVTGVGEQRSLVLADGSELEMNARSKIRVRFTAAERDVELLEGQALFHVAQNPARPFVVQSGSTRVRAVGTRFDVYRKNVGTVVTVLEGRVAVSSHSASGWPMASQPGNADLQLIPGEQVTISASRDARPVRMDTAAAVAWTQHRVTFQRTALSEVAEEFNRYNTRPLRVESPAIQAFLVSGTFSSTDPTSLLHFLSAQPGIDVIETGNEIRIVAKQSHRQP